jgi:glycosyltransferase involved in cell wall biosynthesis
MKPIDVDVIFPFHKDTFFLREAIISAQNSTDVNVRIIAINDSNTYFDKEDLSLRSEDILVASEEKGYQGALLTGMSLTSADYISFLDSDDKLSPDKLFVQLKALKESGADLATGKILRFHSTINHTFESPMSDGIYATLSQREKSIFGSHGADSTIMFKSSVLKETWRIHSSFPARLSDYGWLLSVLPSIRVIHCEQSIYYYRTHPGQMSRFGQLADEWLYIHPLWVDNVLASFGEKLSIVKQLSPSSTQAIVFPTSLPKLNLEDRKKMKSALMLIKSELISKYPEEKSRIKRMIGIRMAIAYRGLNLKYSHYTFIVLLRIFISLANGNRKRN